MKKKIFALIFAIGITGSMLSGCGRNLDSSDTETAQTATEEKELSSDIKPALLLSGSSNDHSWNWL